MFQYNNDVGSVDKKPATVSTVSSGKYQTKSQKKDVEKLAELKEFVGDGN